MFVRKDEVNGLPMDEQRLTVSFLEDDELRSSVDGDIDTEDDGGSLIAIFLTSSDPKATNEVHGAEADGEGESNQYEETFGLS